MRSIWNVWTGMTDKPFNTLGYNLTIDTIGYLGSRMLQRVAQWNAQFICWNSIQLCLRFGFCR